MQFDISELDIRPPLDAVFSNPQTVFQRMAAMNGRIVRDIANRKTINFELAQNRYFLKWHEKVGWSEIIKNLIRLRLPILGAKTEWDALNLLQTLDVSCPKPIVFGATKSVFFQYQSFIVTEEIPGALELDVFFKQIVVMTRAERFRWKSAVVKSVARSVKKMHDAGINHRDLYLCHFMLKNGLVGALPGESIDIAVIDLHRAQMRDRVPARWLIKDLAALYFSAFDVPIGKSHILRFMKLYFGLGLKEILAQHEKTLRSIEKRAIKFYVRDNKRTPVLPV